MPLARQKKVPQKRPVSYFPLPIRMFLLASVAVIGSGYALIRHYTRPHAPMYLPVPPDTGTGNDLEGGLLQAPEVEVLPEPEGSGR